MRGEEARRRIMEAAERLFTSRRVHEITLDEVAKAARVGKGTIYQYFEDKDDLFFQVAASGFDELCELLRERVPGGVGFESQLLSAAKQTSGFFDRRRQLFRMMQGEDSRMYWLTGKMRERWLGKRKKLVSTVSEIMEKGAAEGKVRRDVPPEALASLFLGMLRASARELAEGPGSSRSDELIVDVFCHGAWASEEKARRQRRPSGK